MQNSLYLLSFLQFGELRSSKQLIFTVLFTIRLARIGASRGTPAHPLIHGPGQRMCFIFNCVFFVVFLCLLCFFLIFLIRSVFLYLFFFCLFLFVYFFLFLYVIVLLSFGSGFPSYVLVFIFLLFCFT